MTDIGELLVELRTDPEPPKKPITNAKAFEKMFGFHPAELIDCMLFQFDAWANAEYLGPKEVKP